MLQPNGIRFHSHDPFDRKTFGSHGIFFPKPYSYPIKIIERFGTNFVTRLWGLLASPMPISEEQKTNARKLSLVSCELKYSG
jgi:hypothetical protein